MLYPLDRGERFFLVNDRIYETQEFVTSMIPKGEVIYEVFRVVGSKPIFLREHLDRLYKSCLKTGINCPTVEEFARNILNLLEKNPVTEKNLKISLFFDPDRLEFLQLLAYFIDSRYPTQADYLNGIKLELLPMERENPNVKLENPKMRGAAEKAICLSQTSEVLLVDREGFITEGSRSNFFVLQNGMIITPPSNVVLEGITRSKVLNICKEQGIPLEIRKFHHSELQKIDGAFITGTSPKVLPVNRIGDIALTVGQPLILQIMHSFDELFKAEISSNPT